MFANLKMNARTTLCRSQLKQVGVLITSYMSDHQGFLPYKRANGSYSGDGGKSDIPKPSVGNNEFYRNWNGHLLPYIDVYLKERYNRYAMVTKKEVTRWHWNQLGNVVNPPPADPYTNGWIVVDDAYRKGGHNDLKVFICPEIHANCTDIRAMITYNGIRIPRITQLCNQGFQDQAGFDYGMNGGVPTTYLANGVFFGWNRGTNSYRADQITGFSKKAMVVEGGHAMIDGSGGYPYYEIDYSWYYGVVDGSDLSTTSRLYTNSIQKTSYVHDNYNQFWVMNSQPWSYYFPSFWMGRNSALELAMKFNTQFKDKAYMASGCLTPSGFFGFSLVSFVDPDNGDYFKNFFIANPPGTALTTFKAFTDEPNEYMYLTGNMNVLFGDGSAMTKDQAWLCNNRREIALPSEE